MFFVLFVMLSKKITAFARKKTREKEKTDKESCVSCLKMWYVRSMKMDVQNVLLLIFKREIVGDWEEKYKKYL